MKRNDTASNESNNVCSLSQIITIREVKLFYLFYKNGHYNTINNNVNIKIKQLLK